MGQSGRFVMQLNLFIPPIEKSFIIKSYLDAIIPCLSQLATLKTWTVNDEKIVTLPWSEINSGDLNIYLLDAQHVPGFSIERLSLASPGLTLLFSEAHTIEGRSASEIQEIRKSLLTRHGIDALKTFDQNPAEALAKHPLISGNPQTGLGLIDHSLQSIDWFGEERRVQSYCEELVRYCNLLKLERSKGAFLKITQEYRAIYQSLAPERCGWIPWQQLERILTTLQNQ